MKETNLQLFLPLLRTIRDTKSKKLHNITEDRILLIELNDLNNELLNNKVILKRTVILREDKVICRYSFYINVTKYEYAHGFKKVHKRVYN